MLKKETIDKIAELLKIKASDLTAAITAEAETDLSIDSELITLDAKEQISFRKNGYDEGKKAGEEMAVDAVKKEMGLTYEGKSAKKLAEEVHKKALEDAKIEPDKKVKELETVVGTLKNTVADYEKKLADKDNEVTTVKINSDLYKHIPAMGENGPALGADDVIQLMKVNGYHAKFEDGKTVFYKGDQKVTNKLGEALPAGDVVKTFMTEKKLIAEQSNPGGRGAGDAGGGAKARTLSELKKDFEAQGKSLLGSEFSNAVQEAAKVDGFDMNA